MLLLLLLVAKLAGMNLRRRGGEREGDGAHLVGWKIGEGEALGLMLLLGCHTAVGEDMICCCKEEDGRGEGWGATGGQASLEKSGCWLSTGSAAGVDEDASRDCWLIRITLVVDS